MAYKKISTNLCLEHFEEKAYHSILLKLSPEQMESLDGSGALALGHRSQDVQVWQQMLVGDLVLCFTIGENNKFLACIVSGRGIVSPSPIDPLRIKEERPFLLFLQVVGETANFKIRNEAFYFIDSHETPPRHIFQHLWEQCRPYNISQAVQSRTWASSSRSGYELRIASSHEDFLYISKMAAYHPFGPRRAFLSLLAFHRTEPVGAILVDRGRDIHTTHRSAWRVFRRDYSWIRARSVDIVRLYSSPRAPSKFGIHRAFTRGST